MRKEEETELETLTSVWSFSTEFCLLDRGFRGSQSNSRSSKIELAGQRHLKALNTGSLVTCHCFRSRFYKRDCFSPTTNQPNLSLRAESCEKRISTSLGLYNHVYFNSIAKIINRHLKEYWDKAYNKDFRSRLETLTRKWYGYFLTWQ